MITISDFKRLIKPITNKIFLIIGRGIVTAINNSDAAQKAQLVLLAGETLDKMERFQEYGLETFPPTGCEALVNFINGNRGSGIISCIHSRESRPTDLVEGEVALYTKVDLTNTHRIHLKANGDIQTDAADTTINSRGDTNINSTVDTNITSTEDTNIISTIDNNITSIANLNIVAVDTDINSSGDVTVDGVDITLTGSGDIQTNAVGTDINSSGNVTIDGVNTTITSTGNLITTTTGTATITSNILSSVNTVSAELKSVLVNLGLSPTLTVVMDNFITLYNAHKHAPAGNPPTAAGQATIGVHSTTHTKAS
jgi:phage baseplate assembly protein V